MSLSREVGRALRSTLVLSVLLGLIYPLAMVAFAQFAFPYQANGSLLKNAQGKVIGSELIGQPFTSDKYFNSRPSAINYSTANPGKDKDKILSTGISGGSNLAPSNPDLLKEIQKQIESLGDLKPTTDLVYSSGSGLDPHISLQSAALQIARVAQYRGLQPSELEKLVQQNTDGRFLGIFGEPGVNVLKLNLDLDSLKE